MSIQPKHHVVLPPLGYDEALLVRRGNGIDLDVNIAAIRKTPLLQDLHGQERTDAFQRLTTANEVLETAYRNIYGGLRNNPYGMAIENTPESMASLFYTDSPSYPVARRVNSFLMQMETKLSLAEMIESREGQHILFGATAHAAVELCGNILPHVWEDAHLKGSYLSILYYYAALEQLAMGFKTNSSAFISILEKELQLPDKMILQRIRPVITVDGIQDLHRAFGDSLLNGRGVTPIMSVKGHDGELAYFISGREQAT